MADNDEEPPPPVASVVSEEPESWQWGYPPHPAVAMAQYYEARMRAHAAEYASAAAGAAWAAAQIAASSSPMPPTLPPIPCYHNHHHHQPWHPPPPPPPPLLPQVEEEEHAARPGKRQQIMPQHNNTCKNNESSSANKRGRRRLRSSDSHSSDSRPKHDRGLLGKTGVSALHEWCDKRKLIPKFVIPKCEPHGFVVSVELDGSERGRGRGGTKGIAKQEAARQALQSLLPGVVFDANGILVELPEDLTLSRLAIIGEESKKRQPSSRTWDYPGTSTTSEEDNDYYASRGASVCSALLHAMWQIDDLIPEPPSYTYEVCAAAAKRKGVTGSTAVAVHRSSFACTARLFVKTPLDHEKREGGGAESTGETDDDKFKVMTLSAVGTAATKREARHVASAKLLAMLFPECIGMVEVKAAAEAAREKYAASKALKMQSRRGFASDRDADSSRLPRKRSFDFAIPDASDPPLPDYLSRLLRSVLGHETTSGDDNASADDGDEVSVESLSLSEKVTSSERVTNKEVKRSEAIGRASEVEESVSRSHSRKKQLDQRVDSALQLLNELDDEGRSLPEELNSNDVGRTVLRRADTEDNVWIQQLLAHQEGRAMSISQSRREKVPGPFALVGVPSDALSARTERGTGPSSEELSLSSRLWGSTAITLLLCRAISPKDDPPLGCAVLTLGFSTKKGRTLRIAELVSEPHLPKERFIECLGKFAHHMVCALENELKNESSGTVFSTEQLKSILEAHLGNAREEEAAKNIDQAVGSNGEILDLKTIGASLQSVQEEETEVDDEKEGDAKDARRGTKGDKPCKRSRVV
jgi:hypothetical protein